jgi:hypothetical protein
MENFARRGIRTTVAVAGLAALGVGLAAPTAFALPGLPGAGGVGNTQTTPSAGTPSNLGAAGSAFDALPERFQFAPPAAPSASRSTEPADDESTESETTPSTDSTQADSTQADPTDTEEDPESTSESTEAATTPSNPSPGLLPAIPGSPVAAQASPQVSGVDPSSALQSLDSGSVF